jgi:spore coat polysaccharide biosynthesis protein SpsF
MDQRSFWATEFGNTYSERNNSQELLASNLSFFSDVLKRIEFEPTSFLELGANIGMNIKALRFLLPEAIYSGVEINPEACKQLETLCDFTYETSIEDFSNNTRFDFVFSKGVLIHIAPENLPIVYEKMVKCTKRWLLIAEYYNPTPVTVDYRGHSDKLFKRDFAGEVMDRFPEMKLKDYGFLYHRGIFPQDDITWFLLEKDSNFD